MAAPDGVRMDERQVDHVELVLDGPRVMHVPHLGALGVGEAAAELVEHRQVVRCVLGLAVEHPDEAERIHREPRAHAEVLGHFDLEAVRRYGHHAPVGGIAQAVERAVHVPAFHAPLREIRTAVAARAVEAGHVALTVAPEH